MFYTYHLLLMKSVKKEICKKKIMKKGSSKITLKKL